MSQNNLIDVYPLSKLNSIKGSRRLAREKVLQILVAYKVCETDLNQVFDHIFFREFNFESGSDIHHEKLLRPDEIYELEADIPIDWKEENIIFGKKLLQFALHNAKEIEDLIEKYAQNWDIDRIAIIDKALITIAATELINFPDIPPKVSINEALDIAKSYSTDKSRIFINGVLDSILEELKTTGKLAKEGRGLKNE